MIKERKKLKRQLLWTAIVVLSVVLFLLVALVVSGMIPNWLNTADRTQDTAGSTEAQNTQSTTVLTAPTVPTEPPIPLNRFGPEDFGYNEQGYLTCLSEPCLMGIDVSSYQKDIDWQKVKEAGFSFVMIRVGGRSYGSSGKLYEDKLCQSHYKGAKEAGLLVGAYFFSQAINTEEAAEEAYYALEQVADWEMDLPLVFDWEYIDDEKRTAFIYEDIVTECVKTFCEIVKENGREPMFYVSPWFGRMKLEELKEYPQWLALYKDHMDYDYHFDMWQYTSSGKVPGISGAADINIYFPPDK